MPVFQFSLVGVNCGGGDNSRGIISRLRLEPMQVDDDDDDDGVLLRG